MYRHDRSRLVGFKPNQCMVACFPLCKAGLASQRARVSAIATQFATRTSPACCKHSVQFFVLMEHVRIPGLPMKASHYVILPNPHCMDAVGLWTDVAGAPASCTHTSASMSVCCHEYRPALDLQYMQPGCSVQVQKASIIQEMQLLPEHL